MDESRITHATNVKESGEAAGNIMLPCKIIKHDSFVTNSFISAFHLVPKSIKVPPASMQRSV